MGIDINGGMIVGAAGDDLSVPEDYISEYTPDEELSLSEWAEEIGLEYYSEWYDAGDNGRVYGFIIKSVWGENDLEKLIKEVKQLMIDFKKLTGVKAKLYGMQNVW